MSIHGAMCLPKVYGMTAKQVVLFILYAIGLLLGIVSLVYTYTGLPWPGKDTEPLLAFGLFLVAIAGMASIRD